MRSVNSAYRAKLQEDGNQIIELIDLECANKSYHWTTGNVPITATWSGVSTSYDVFPGATGSGIQESTDLAVAVIDFVMANTGDLFAQVLAGGDFAQSALSVSRVFADTPGLDRMSIYVGRIGDYIYDRNKITGQARNVWQSLSVRWPYYTFQDGCSWRFGSTGCGFNTASVTIFINTVASLSGQLLTLVSGTLSSSFDNGRFDFGRVTVTSGPNAGQARAIISQVGDAMTLSRPLSVQTVTGLTLSVYPGCRKRLLEDCRSLYNNEGNFLGFPWIPIQEDVVENSTGPSPDFVIASVGTDK